MDLRSHKWVTVSKKRKRIRYVKKQAAQLGLCQSETNDKVAKFKAARGAFIVQILS